MVTFPSEVPKVGQVIQVNGPWIDNFPIETTIRTRRHLGNLIIISVDPIQLFPDLTFEYEIGTKRWFLSVEPYERVEISLEIVV